MMRPNVLRKSGSRTRSRLIALNARLRACRKCHLAGFLDERESVPVVRDPEPDAPLPRILLIGQAPGLRATLEDRPFAGAAGDKLRDWLEQAGIPRGFLAQGALRRDHPLLPRASPRSERRPRPIAPGTSPLPSVARRSHRCPPAENRASGRPARDPHFPRPSRLVDSRRGHFHGSRRRSLHPPAASLRRQPMAERTGQSRGG